MKYIQNDKYIITPKEKPRFYTTKCIVSGKLLEVYKYHRTQVGKRDSSISKNARTNTNKGNINSNIGMQTIDRKLEYINKSRRDLKRLINANLHQGRNQDKFLTLTFAKNITDKQYCLLKYRSFIKSLQRSFKSIKYITILEKQKRGAFHFHIILFDFPYIDLEILNNKWKHGFTDVQAIKNHTYIKNGKKYDFASYLVKYMGKEFGGTSTKGERRYYKSNNLLSPILLYDESVESLLNNIDYHKECDFQFDNDFVGTVDYEKIIAHDKIAIKQLNS